MVIYGRKIKMLSLKKILLAIFVAPVILIVVGLIVFALEFVVIVFRDCGFVWGMGLLVTIWIAAAFAHVFVEMLNAT
jgi:hypothetical protein